MYSSNGTLWNTYSQLNITNVTILPTYFVWSSKLKTIVAVADSNNRFNILKTDAFTKATQYIDNKFISLIRATEKYSIKCFTSAPFGQGKINDIKFPAIINEAADNLDPSKIAIYAFNLAKLLNTFYTEHSIANADTDTKKQLRIKIGILTAATLQKAMGCLGIAVPEQM